MVIYKCLAEVAAETAKVVNMGVILALMPLYSTLLASVLASEKLTVACVVGEFISIELLYLTSRGNSDGLARRRALIIVLRPNATSRDALLDRVTRNANILE